MSDDLDIHYQSGGLLHSPLRKAVFLDRDRTLNADPGYLNDPDLVELLPGVVRGLQKLQSAGFMLTIISNQSGVGRGRITEEQLFAVNRRLLELLSREYIRVERIYYCPHTDEDRCICRKPAPGLVRAALQDFRLQPSHCWIVGDRFRDLQCATEAGIPGILVGEEEVSLNLSIGLSGQPLQDALKGPANLLYHAPDMDAVADYILHRDPTVS